MENIQFLVPNKQGHQTSKGTKSAAPIFKNMASAHSPGYFNAVYSLDRNELYWICNGV